MAPEELPCYYESGCRASEISGDNADTRPLIVGREKGDVL
jgi:hypothetical protein